MSEPLKNRMEDESGLMDSVTQIRVLPSPATPPPMPLPPAAAENKARVPRVALHHGGRFIEPEEVDIEAGFREQEALEAENESAAKGCLGGVLAALFCTVAGGGFAALTGAWYGFFSVGIGFIVAFGVRKLGRGNSAQFGIIGATWALLGCMGAHHLASAIVMARAEEQSLFEFLRSVESWSGFMESILGPKDLVFYAVAAFFGYRYSHDAVADKY